LVAALARPTNNSLYHDRETSLDHDRETSLDHDRETSFNDLWNKIGRYHRNMHERETSMDQIFFEFDTQTYMYLEHDRKTSLDMDRETSLEHNRETFGT